MKFGPAFKVMIILIAVFLVASFFFLLEDIVPASTPVPAPGSEQAQKIIPLFPVFAETDSEKELIFYPQLPAPGDFMIVEAGPLSDEVEVELAIDFPGSISHLYRLGGLLYAVVAISYNTEPGSYSLIIRAGNEEQGSDILSADILISDKEFLTSQFSMPASRTEGWTAERLAEDREKVRLARETTEPYPLWTERFINPLEGRITSEYGAIRIINQNPPRRHSGIDIATEEGEPIIAPNRGVVRLSEFLLSGGYTVIIDHGMGLSSTYMHLHELAVKTGEVVERGEKIGTVGMTGYATGPHLHWEVNIGQVPVNPEQLLDNELLWIPPAYVMQKIN